MNAKWLLATCLASWCVVPCWAADPKTDMSDSDRLQGNWQVISLVTDGKQEKPEAIKKMSLAFTGSEYMMVGGESEFQGVFSLEDSKKPKWIDSAASDDDKDGGSKGIYKFDGEKLTICWAEEGKDRPTAFVSKPGSGHRLIALERIKQKEGG